MDFVILRFNAKAFCQQKLSNSPLGELKVFVPQYFYVTRLYGQDLILALYIRFTSDGARRILYRAGD